MPDHELPDVTAHDASYIGGLKVELEAAVARGEKDHESLVRTELDRMLRLVNRRETAVMSTQGTETRGS
jgi:hypothetical protein